jgi:hypothetical protein
LEYTSYKSGGLEIWISFYPSLENFSEQLECRRHISRECVECETNRSLIFATFPKCEFMWQLLARKKAMKQQEYIVFGDCNACDNFIANYYLNMETTYFTINKGRQLCIKVGSWCSSKHPP